jgi:1-acyl-sn-glycerol-3-phosphate acyltransferase
VWIGRRLDDREAAQAVARGVTAVLDVSAELSEPRAFTRVAYKNIQVVDLTAPTPAQLDDAVRFITAHAGEGIVYVHCKIGYSRSAAAVGAYLLAAGLARTTREAIAMLRVARPSIVVRPEAIAALRQFEARPRGRARRPPRSVPAAVVAALLAAVARIVCGTSSRWLGCEPSLRQRIYFANHTSHADFVVLWASLPADVRAHTRPVAGRDYWDRSSVRRYLARQVFRAVLVDRREPAAHADGAPSLADARRSVQRAARALATGASLIIFPEGTRGDGSNVRPFKSGLYHLCRLRPDVELVPVRLENMHRILPKGEALPVPITGSVTFGRPMRLEPGEGKHAFLARAQRALLREERPCTSLPIPILRAS